MADFLCAAVACDEDALAGSGAVFVRNHEAVFVEIDKPFKGFVVGHLTNANECALAIHSELFLCLSVFKAKTREFVVAEEFFERDIFCHFDVGLCEHEIDECFVCKEFVEEHADMHGLAVA